MKKSGYMTRAMKSRDPRFARVLGKLGYERSDMAATEADVDNDKSDDDDLVAARVRYQEAVGKRAYHGWSVEELDAKIEESKG
jgi:ribosome-binding protein aMBF1 (putative translation factor)